jgi:hypothetical protein
MYLTNFLPTFLKETYAISFLPVNPHPQNAARQRGLLFDERRNLPFRGAAHHLLLSDRY